MLRSLVEFHRLVTSEMWLIQKEAIRLTSLVWRTGGIIFQLSKIIHSLFSWTWSITRASQQKSVTGVLCAPGGVAVMPSRAICSDRIGGNFIFLMRLLLGEWDTMRQAKSLNVNAFSKHHWGRWHSLKRPKLKIIKISFRGISLLQLMLK